MLAAPDFTCPFKLDVGASAQGLGAVLMQEDGKGIDHHIGYFLKKFKKNQVHYSTVEKEALSLFIILLHTLVPPLSPL